MYYSCSIYYLFRIYSIFTCVHTCVSVQTASGDAGQPLKWEKLTLKCCVLDKKRTPGCFFGEVKGEAVFLVCGTQFAVFKDSSSFFSGDSQRWGSTVNGWWRDAGCSIRAEAETWRSELGETLWFQSGWHTRVDIRWGLCWFQYETPAEELSLGHCAMWRCKIAA